MVLAPVLFGLLFSQIISFVSRLDKGTRALRCRVDAVDALVRVNGLPADLARRMLAHVAFVSSRERAAADTASNAVVLSLLSGPLRREAVVHQCDGLVVKVPLFRAASSAFRYAVMRRLVPQLHSPDDVVLREGDECPGLWLVAEGALQVRSSGLLSSKASFVVAPRLCLSLSLAFH